MKRIEEKGITLIALVITIIVLLILAAVSITTLTGQNGILSRAGEAVEETGRKTAEEKVAVEVLGSYGKDGNIDYDLLNENLKNVEGLTSGLPIIALPKTVVVDGYNVTIDIEGNVEVENENPSSGESEAEAMVLDYGKRVNYISKVDDSLTWRIFYDDENYVYLISSKADGSGTVKNFSLLNYINNYSNGSEDIAHELRYLNQQWFNALEGTSTSNIVNRKAVACLMDQNMWSEYKDNEGNAKYAIGSPTLELFMKSYNATSRINSRLHEIKITSCTTIGYTQNTEEGWLSSEYNNGIYNGIDSDWWIASTGPAEGNMLRVDANNECLGVYGISTNLDIRPVVIIPKSDFQYSIIEE